MNGKRICFGSMAGGEKCKGNDEERASVGGSERRVVWEGDIDMFAGEEGCGAVWLGFRRPGRDCEGA